VDYQQGITGPAGEYREKHPTWLFPASFSRLEASIHQTVPLGVFNKFAYRLVAGGFFNKNPFNYIDYKHFSTGGAVWLNFSDWTMSYALLPLYSYSTNKNWIQAFATYHTDYLVIKRLPFLQGKLFMESLHAKFLHTPDKRYYSEWGYSVDFLAGLATAGVFVAFDSFQYAGYGLQLSLPLVGKIKNRKEEVVVTVGL
jgi:hypothetical protein